MAAKVVTLNNRALAERCRLECGPAGACREDLGKHGRPGKASNPHENSLNLPPSSLLWMSNIMFISYQPKSSVSSVDRRIAPHHSIPSQVNKGHLFTSIQLKMFDHHRFDHLFPLTRSS